MDLTWCSFADESKNYDLWRRQILAKTEPSIDESLLLNFILWQLRYPVSECDQHFSSIRTSFFENEQQWGKYLYLKSIQLRSMNQLDESLKHASDAFLRLQQIKSPLFLVLRAQMAALYFELKKIHFSAECCQEVIDHPESPWFAKSIARDTLGNIWLMIGHYSSIASESSEFSRDTIHRLKLQSELVYGKTDYLEEILSFADYEKPSAMLALEAVIGVYFFGDELLRVKFQNSWIVPYFKKLSGSMLFSKALRLIDGQTKVIGRTSSSWIESLWNKYFDFLALIDHGFIGEAIDVMVKDISPSFHELHIFCPLMPHLLFHRFYPDNKIAAKFNALFSGKDEVTKRSFVEITKDTISLHLEGNIRLIKMERAATSLQLLRVLAGPAGNKTTKEEIHRQLSDQPYDSYVHDSRIYKLLKRLQAKLSENGFPNLWELPGDNHVEINYDFVIR